MNPHVNPLAAGDSPQTLVAQPVWTLRTFVSIKVPEARGVRVAQSCFPPSPFVRLSPTAFRPSAFRKAWCTCAHDVGGSFQVDGPMEGAITWNILCLCLCLCRLCRFFFELFRKKIWFIQILFVILAKINSNAYIIVCIYMHNLKVIKTKKTKKKINFFCERRLDGPDDIHRRRTRIPRYAMGKPLPSRLQTWERGVWQIAHFIAVENTIIRT